jgi:hypothetical protein
VALSVRELQLLHCQAGDPVRTLSLNVRKTEWLTLSFNYINGEWLAGSGQELVTIDPVHRPPDLDQQGIHAKTCPRRRRRARAFRRLGPDARSSSASPSASASATC